MFNHFRFSFESLESLEAVAVVAAFHGHPIPSRCGKVRALKRAEQRLGGSTVVCISSIVWIIFSTMLSAIYRQVNTGAIVVVSIGI